MSLLSPKPIIAHVHRTWSVSPGMTFALVEDMEHALWVVESCPAGTHFWSLEQAAALSLGAHTRRPVAEAVREGRQIVLARQPQPVMVSKQAMEPMPTRATSRPRLVSRETKSTPPARSKPRSARTLAAGKCLVNA